MLDENNFVLMNHSSRPTGCKFSSIPTQGDAPGLLQFEPSRLINQSVIILS